LTALGTIVKKKENIILCGSKDTYYLGDPKGIQRPVGGHIVTLCWSMNAIYGMDKNSVWWAASDLGWVVGISYICYGPLLYGATSVMYEGKPDRTPDAAQYFRSLEYLTFAICDICTFT
jgi:acyl-coenzyme A synthetase/AMP-(fatty) acid ligase